MQLKDQAAKVKEVKRLSGSVSRLEEEIKEKYHDLLKEQRSSVRDEEK